MSYFLYLSVPQRVALGLHEAFDSSLTIMDVTETPIGKEVRGRQSWPVFTITLGQDSARLVGKGAASEKARRKQDRSGLAVAGIRLLMSREECVFATLFLHWMSGDLMGERVSPKETRHISMVSIDQSICELEEDVLYILGRNYE